jgi:hypothetical protein
MQTDRPDSLKEFSSAELKYLLNLSAGRISQLEGAGVVIRTRPGFYDVRSIPNFIAFLRKSGEAAPKDWQTVRSELGREKLALLRLERGVTEGSLLEKR